METKIGIAKLKPHSKNQVLELLDQTRQMQAEAKAHMQDKGYYWDSVFIHETNHGDYLIYVCKSPDWSKIKRGDESPLNEWSELYLEWKDLFWESNTMTPQDDLLCADLKIEPQ